jgi:hypothetical protein
MRESETDPKHGKDEKDDYARIGLRYKMMDQFAEYLRSI